MLHLLPGPADLGRAYAVHCVRFLLFEIGHLRDVAYDVYCTARAHANAL